jgi:hypothetical protein
VALLAWGPEAVVLAFRGSASAENLRTDAKLRLVPHPPRRRARLPRSLSAPLRSRGAAIRRSIKKTCLALACFG